MADLTLGPNYPADGSLSLTTDWKEIELTGEPGFLMATLPKHPGDDYYTRRGLPFVQEYARRIFRDCIIAVDSKEENQSN